MAQFIIIEIDQNAEYEDNAEVIKSVSDMVAEGFVAGQEDKARFEILTTVNHVSMYDVWTTLKSKFNF